ncbi:MAG: hypothetical protein HYZ53_05675 [Planctomycetes bacterium]|nr:hypothetical protein [Planctomycetota bacterium]
MPDPLPGEPSVLPSGPPATSDPVPPAPAGLAARRARSAAGPAGWWGTLALILALGAAWRLAALETQGVALYDEAVYLNTARFLAAGVRALPEALEYGRLLRSADADAAERRERLRGELRARVPTTFLPFLGKPGHELLLAAALLAGADPGIAGGLVSGFFATLLALGAACSARRAYGGGPGLLAAFLLACSPLSILYSRSFLAELDSSCILGAAVTLTAAAAAGGRRRPLLGIFAGGVLGGLAFDCNSRLVIVPVLLAATLAAARRTQRATPAPPAHRAGIWLCAGMALPLLLGEAVYYPVLWWLGLPRSCIQFTFFDRLLFMYGGQGLRNAGFGDVRPLGYLFLSWEGPVAVVLITTGAVLAAARRERADLPLLAWLLTGLALFLSRTSEQCLRYLAILLPPGAVLAAGLFRRDGPWWLRPLAHPVAPAVAALAFVLTADPGPVLRCTSGWEPALHFVRHLGPAGKPPRYFLEEEEIGWCMDFPETRAARLPDTEPELERMVRDGRRYLVVGPNLLASLTSPEYFTRFLEDLRRRVPAWEFEHPLGAQPRFSHEFLRWDGEPFELSRLRVEHMARVGGKIRIYDLGAYYR